ncbi:MAG: cobalamin-binding protein [Pseudomonadota bacterium]
MLSPIVKRLFHACRPGRALLAAIMAAPVLLAAGPCHGAIAVKDDAGAVVTLAQPARRIVSMSPHVTELLFAAGGGERIVGAMNFSDYPAAAAKIPLIGDNSQIDIERVLALKPDLLVVWQSGNTARQLEQLARLGIPIFYSEPKTLDEVATSLTRLGRLLGTGAVAEGAAAAYRARIAALGARYGRRAPVRVFYQVWDRPLYTLSGAHIVSDALRLCGGVNVFGALKVVAPQVGVEAVLQEDPEAIFGGRAGDAPDAGINQWKAYPGMLAVRRANLFSLDGETLARATPRIADGATVLCEKLEQARQKRR